MKNTICICLVLLLAAPFNGSGQHNQSWEILFDGKDLAKWQSAKGAAAPIEGWEIKDGLLSIAPRKEGKGSGRDLVTKEEYKDFELTWSFQLTKGANTGIKYLLNQLQDEKGKTAWVGAEYQLIDDVNYPWPPNAKAPEGLTGALYLIYPANKKKKWTVEGWNTASIIKKGNKVEHWLNGRKIVSYEWGSNDFKRRVSATKFNAYPGFVKSRSGRILLQDHGDRAYFKDIRIRRLD